MTCLVDPSRTDAPMSRREAHDLMAQLAAKAYNEKRPFYDILLRDLCVTTRIDIKTLIGITDASAYIGQSREIIERNFRDLHGRTTFPDSL